METILKDEREEISNYPDIKNSEGKKSAKQWKSILETIIALVKAFNISHSSDEGNKGLL